ncbi:TPA: SMR family transporter [Escherichia coli]|uniref:DMT family transporter n=1 Tax=Escherichia coli TaxID=562 RepID=UPI0019D1ED16|nr:SMR family transporter [Escherichia coli]EKR7174323.1 EamA family transporter [Escherichia coli]MBN6692603.1 EamA family transporter [Escherichia coli]MDP4344690.1 SMR family transporter [Escherichia coli]MDP4370781.1 SMR family transporter [Escherichia coli]HCN1811240.1 EamA family transporter [Escherichia coli]
MSVFTFLLALISVSLNALAQVALRKTMLSISSFPSAASEYFNFGLSLLINPWFITGMGCYVVSIGLWMAVLGKVEVSLAYPLLSVGYIITAIIGYFFLKEDVNMMRMIGLALICSGIIFISRSA